MSEPSYLPAGAVLQDRYEIAREIGRGGYSVVYLARDRRVGANVAIKLLVPPPAAARLARERLRREVQAVRQLEHPNIVAVYDVADEGPWSYVVMEYVAGPDLAVRVSDRGPIDADRAARVGRDVAAALVAAHRRGILHRDVKPQNILLAPDGRARLTDFGSARLVGQATVTQTGGFVGTLAYAAPEMLGGARGDARADLYALGLTLYYALTAELPGRPARQAPPGPETNGHRPGGRGVPVPPWLDAAVARATAADPDDRFPSVALFASALEPAAGDNAVQAAPPAKGRCMICRAVEPLGLGVCPRCARRGGGSDDVLVFVERASAGPARQAVLDALAQRLPGASAAGRAATAGGERPLLRVPADAAGRVVELLDVQGIPARTESLPAAWRTTVPTPVSVLAGLVAAGGLAAGFVAAAPALLVSGPVVAVALVSIAALGRRTPVWDPPATGRGTLPAEAERQAVRALTALPAGTARGLLIDVVRRATAVKEEGEAIGPLVVAACAAARDLAGLELHLDAFDAQRDRLGEASAGWLDAVARCELGRDALTQRLLEASTALARRHADALRGADSSGEALAELTRDLDAEARLQAEAAQEVAKLFC